MTLVFLALAAFAADAAAKTPVEAASGYRGGQPGVIELIGRVSISKLPPPKKFSVKRYADKCGAEKSDQSVIYSGDGGLSNVVVWIDGIKQGKDLPKDGLTLRNITCTYEPRVAAAVTGTTLEIKNYDALQMIAFGLLEGPKKPLFHTTLPVKGLGFKRKLDAAGLVNVHGDNDEQPWANAWVYVFDHPYATVSEDGGYFTIDKLPEGEFTLHFWHERYGEKQRPLSLKAGAADARMRVDLRYD